MGETKKIDAIEGKSWDHEFLYKLCPMLSKFILKYSLLYTVIMRNHQGQQRAKSNSVGKENTKCCLRDVTAVRRHQNHSNSYKENI